MGVDIALLKFFDICHTRRALEGPMLALGSLEIQEPSATLEAFARENGYQTLLKERSVRSLFADRYRLEDYESCDINQPTDLNLNAPLERKYHGAFKSILNGGTLEHVFDLRQSMENVHDATTVGGVMIHTTPVTWYNHGLFNFNPIMFHLMAETNDYEIVAEGFYYNLSTFPDQTRPIVSIIGEEGKIPGTNVSAMSLWSGHQLPANAMHLIALRKLSSNAFVPPRQFTAESGKSTQSGPATLPQPEPASPAQPEPAPSPEAIAPAHQPINGANPNESLTPLNEYFERIPLGDEYTHAGGNCWLSNETSLTPGNTAELLGQSPAAMFENGARIGPPNAMVDHITNVGAGAYNHWESAVYFSSSDNSDPRTNGRDYSLRLPLPKRLPAVRELRWNEKQFPLGAETIDLYLAAVIADEDLVRVIKKYAEVTMLHWHVLAIYDLLAHRSRAVAVEIGAYVGGGTLALSRAAKGPFISIECGGSYLGHPSMPSEDIIADLKTNLRRHDQLDRVEIVEAPSGSPKAISAIDRAAAQHGGIDLLLIDADGDIERDLRICLPYMTEDCVLVLDDYYRTLDYKGAQVIEAVDRLVGDGALKPFGLYGWGTWVGKGDLAKLAASLN